MEINQDQILQLRQHSGLPQDQMPTHVTGGVPIQRYLQTLLERVPDLALDDAFVMASAVPDHDILSGSRSTVRTDPQLDDSSVFQHAFLHDFIQWTNRHVRVKVNIPDVDRSCYVWQSVLDATVSTSNSGHSDVALNPHEVNIGPQPEEEGNDLADNQDPLPENDLVGPADQAYPADMYRR